MPEHGKPNPIEAAIDTASPARVTVDPGLAVLIGAYAAGTSRDSWRHPTGDNRRYFAALADWGCPLSPVEQLVCAPDPTAASADTSAAAEPATEPADDTAGPDTGEGNEEDTDDIDGEPDPGTPST